MEHKTTNKAKLLSLLLVFAVIFAAGCKKENVQTSDEFTSSAKDRLALSKAGFDDLYVKLRKTNGKELPSELSSRFPEFISLQHNKSKMISKTALSIRTGSPLMIARKASLKASLAPQQPNEATMLTYDEVMTEIVDDQAFKSLLNVEGEIQVADIIYKVTPFGTFFAPVGQEAALDGVFADVALQNRYTIRLEDNTGQLAMDGLVVENTQQNEVKLLNKNVFFIDSFIEENLPQPEVIVYQSDDVLYPQVFPNSNLIVRPPVPNDPPIGESFTDAKFQSNFLQNQPIMTSPFTSDPAYQNMQEYPIEFKKGLLGIESIFQTLFTNSTRYNYFNGNYRMSALMYNRNYAILKTIGVKVKCQKEGWVWWNKTNAQEIRAGWDYMAYTSPSDVEKITLPNTDFAPTIGAPYLINPTEDPFYGVPMWGSNNSFAKRYNLYGWYMKRGSNELFTIMIPGGLVPFKPHGVEVPASVFKNAIHTGWNELRKVLRKSAPPSGTSYINPNADDFKFPVYVLNAGPYGGYNEVKYFSIKDMENMPKSFNPTIEKSEVFSDNKIHTFVSPYEAKVYNDDSIDIPLDASSVKITISSNLNKLALDYVQIAKSLLTTELGKSYNVYGASVFGAVKYNNQWKGIRLKVKMKE